jgi:serine/threonine-protein kinase
MAIEAGRVLNQRYRLIRPVGQGSQASVWVAEHLALQTHVAVKLIDPELAKKESARERFRREATAAAQLRSAHVVQILDHGIDGDQPFIVMELLDGEDLFERLAHRTRLTLRETSKIVTQVARALSRAHAAGIVHRDLKPENVFLCPNEDDEVVKVLDFGVAKVKDAAKVTMQKTGVGTLIGTPHYMSPEQVKGIGEIDHHTDIWALGVIAFQCMTGELPFDSEGVGDLLIKITIGDAPIPSKVYPGIPPTFDAWFAKACAREPKNRFQSAREMAVALAGIVNAAEGNQVRSPTVRPPAATLPGLSAQAKPRPETQHLDAGDFEEIDPFDEDDDEAPTRMKGPSEQDAAAIAAAIAKNGAPAGPAAPAKPAPIAPPVSSGKAPPKPGVAPPRPGGAGAGGAVVSAVAAKPAPPPSTPISVKPPAAGEAHDAHEIVDFDETIPATAEHRPSIAVPLLVRAGTPPSTQTPALAPLSEPPRASESAPASEAAAPARSERPQVIAPVVMPPPRPAVAPPPGPDAAPPSIPRPPPSSRHATPQSSARAAGGSAAPVVTPLESPTRSGALLTEPPPELDGSGKRKRMVRFMVATLVIAAAGITWTVVRSQLDPGSGSVGTPTSSATTTPAPPPPPPPAPEPSATTTTTAAAVDPGKVTHPSKPAPAVKGPLRRPTKKSEPSDGTVVVPDPPSDDSVAPAP